MAEGNKRADVNEMFQKMGEKLGWFKCKSSDEVKQLVTLSAKKTKIKKENGGQAADNANGKKASKLKLKKKRVITNLPEEVGKSVPHSKQTDSKQTMLHAKAQSFKDLLSSDSDSSEPMKSKRRTQKAVLQICSDSDEDRECLEKVQPNSNTCIKESFLESGKATYVPEFEPILFIEPKQESDIDWNDTVVKNRVSLASFTVDLDNLGEPLVESTRIHRRSSVTYKQILDSSGSLSEDASDLGTAAEEKIQEGKQENCNKYTDGVLTFMTSVCEETKYVTAVETSDDTINLSNTHKGGEEAGNTSSGVTSDKHVKACVGERNVQCNRDETNVCTSDRRKHIESNCSDSFIEIEVIDASTQTDDYAVGGDVVKQTCDSNREVHGAYRENTVVDDNDVTTLCTHHKGLNDVYCQDTVEYSHQSADVISQSENKLSSFETEEHSNIASSTDAIQDLENRFASTTLQTHTDEYSRQTVTLDSENESCIKSDVYNEVTSPCNDDIFEHKTDIKHSLDMHFDQVTNASVSSDFHFENDTNVGTDINTELKNIESKYENITGDEINNYRRGKPDSDESLYEVCDAGTQTEERSFEKLVGKNKVTDGEEIKNSTELHEVKIVRDSSRECEQNESLNADDQDEFYVEDTNPDDVEKSYDSDVTESSSAESLNSGDIGSENMGNVNTSTSESLETSGVREQENNNKKKSDITEQSWRSGRKYSSDSSSDGDLEAFLQKLRKPEEKKSDTSSPVSLKDFIVEDDDISSDSEDSGFYLRENNEIENRKEQQIVPVLGSEDDSDDFSSKIYPSSVTKHKKKVQAKARKQAKASWSFSSDSEDDTKAANQKPARKPVSISEKTDLTSDKQRSFLKTSFRNPQLNLDENLSTDSEDEVFNVKTNKLDDFDNKEFIREGKDGIKITDSDSGSLLNGTGQDKKVSTAFDDEQILFKTPNVLRKKKKFFEDDKENEFKTPVSTTGKVAKTPKSSTKPVYISLSDTDSGDNSSGFTVSLSDSSANSRVTGTPKTFSKLSSPLSLKNTVTPKSATVTPTCTFLKSLSNTADDSRRHTDAKRFVNNFSKFREELSSYLFQLYNRTVFENKLPTDIPVIWNKRLLRTAGYCAYKKNAKNDKDRSTRIELSVKVCDNAERVRDTLIHEMCHAAVWLLNGVNGGHGPYWKYWARHATRVHPELPAVSVCHSYSINTKFTYRCKTCGYSIGRHSKSLDVKKKVCGYCRGEFELIRNSVPTTPTSSVSSSSLSTPRPASKFALFVKDNYNSVKRQNQSLKHGDVMKELSKLFAESKITS